MIIVTSNLVEQDWEKVYGVYLLAETNVIIPWYIKKWGENYNTPPDYIPHEEGVYGNPLSPVLHHMRVCLVGENWSEETSPELISLVKSASPGLNQLSYIGIDILEEKPLLAIFGIQPK